ncbi:hypothetical protein GCM10027040_32850 [Halomonas shantousis]
MSRFIQPLCESRQPRRLGRLHTALLGMLMLATLGTAGQALAERPQVELRDSKRLHPEVRRHGPDYNERRHRPESMPRIPPRVEVEVNGLSTRPSSDVDPSRRTGEDSPPPGATLCRDDSGGVTWSTRGQGCDESDASSQGARTYSTSPR